MRGDLRRDLRFGARSLRRAPVVAAAAVVSIALGIAATTSVFSVVDAALFRPPPLDHPGELAILYTTSQSGTRPQERARWSWPRFRALSRLTTSFDQVGSFSTSVVALTSGEPEPIAAEVVSSSYLPVLRVTPIAGRGFTPDDDESGAAPVALLGYDLWQRRFGGDPAVVGRVTGVNGISLTVVGILPRGFHGLSGRAQLFVPATTAPRITFPEYLTINEHFISVVGRLSSGTTIEQARAELSQIGTAIRRAAPNPDERPDRVASATAVSLNEARVDPTTRAPLLLLLGAVACLLSLACANVAGLLLGRAVSRRREIAIRLATGASRGRIVRQLLAESAVLAVAGGAMGALMTIPIVANLGMPAPLSTWRNFYGALGEFAAPHIDARVLLFSFAVCAITTLAIGLLPSMQATRLDVTAALRGGGNGRRAGRRRRRVEPRNLIVGIETALALILLVAGGALAASWRRLATADTGFDRTHLLTFTLRPSEVAYPSAKAPALLDRVLVAIERVPGVDAASVDGCAPMGAGCARSTLFIMGRPQPAAVDAPSVRRHYVGPDHFRVLRVPVLRGRAFDERDRAGSPRVAIINQTAAARFWPNEDPIDRRVWFGSTTFDRPDSSAEIVGVVGDVAYESLDRRPFEADFYTPYAQFTYAMRTVLVRTRQAPLGVVAGVRRAVASVDPNLALFDVRSMDERAGESWARLSYQTRLLMAFAIAASLLAAVGIFSIVAHGIDARRRELAVRTALGASPMRVMQTVGRQGLGPAAIGLLAGTAGAALAVRVLAASVYGVRGFDPGLIGAGFVGVALVAVCAALLAARRVLVIDPVSALKLE